MSAPATTEAKPAAPAAAPAPPLPYRACVSLVASGDYVYCLGGEDLQKHRSAAVYRVKIAELSQTQALP